MKKLKIAFVLFAGIFLCLGSTAMSAHLTKPGNNLSLPVIWAEGKKLGLRGEYGAPVFDGAYTVVDGVNWYHQQDAYNEWQAEWLDAAAPVHVTWIDWGDNLEAHPWTIWSIVRTEVVLYQDVSASPMTGFEMMYLGGEGIEEIWGTNGVTYLSDISGVYSGVARYTIQKLGVTPYDEANMPIDNSILGLSWNAASGQWEGDEEWKIGALLYNSAVWEGEGIHGKEVVNIYSAELNVPGKVIYGYNWNLKRMNDGPGYYRITFSLDDSGTGCPVPRNTFFTEGVTEVLLSENVEGGGIGVVDYANHLTYIDILIVPR